MVQIESPSARWSIMPDEYTECVPLEDYFLNRRCFVSLAASAAAMELVSARASAGQSTPVLRIDEPRVKARLMPLDFIGLSYEMGQLYNQDYFSPRNAELIRRFSGLSEHGVLRLGGHLSNITPWEGVGQNDPKQMRGVRHGIEDYWEWPLVDPTVQRNKQGIITRTAIKNLRGFLDAVNWKLIYGFNFRAEAQREQQMRLQRWSMRWATR